MDCVDRFLEIRAKVPEEVKIVAVSKFKQAAEIGKLFSETGHTLFGENRAQEMKMKAGMLSPLIEWQFIGHLQSNKVKMVVPAAGMIQSVDSYRLLQEIDREAGKEGKVINCLLQVFIAREDTKFGFSDDELAAMVCDSSFERLQHVHVCGLMGMATYTSDRQQVAGEFRSLRRLFETMKAGALGHNGRFDILSMGMTGDYQIAIDEGSTMVRIGSAIFGDR